MSSKGEKNENVIILYGEGKRGGNVVLLYFCSSEVLSSQRYVFSPVPTEVFDVLPGSPFFLFVSVTNGCFYYKILNIT